jgi:hypothetical protein
MKIIDWILFLALLSALAGCSCQQVERRIPVRLIEFEIKIEGGKTIHHVRTWDYEGDK